MLQKKNQTDNVHFESFNLASDNFTIFPDHVNGTRYDQTCEFRELMNSNPDIVFLNIGGKDSLNK